MRSRQRGQSMTEYLVVLGVTGAALVATLTDVGSIFDSVHDNYAAQSREMNRIQLYDSHRVRFSEASPTEDFDDGTPEAPTPDLDLPEPSLPTGLFDELGNLLGTREGNYYLDQQGNIIATCDISGVCLDNDGNTVTPTPIGDTGKPLPLLALYDEQDNLLGFAYYRGGSYFHASSYQALSLPAGVSVDQREPANNVYVGSSKHVAGYESRGKIYSLASVYMQSNLAANTLIANHEQLLAINYTTPPAGWENLSPCVVMSNAQMADISTISVNGFSTPLATLGASGKQALNDPQSLRYIKRSAADCNAAKQVTRYPGDIWVISDK